MQKQKITQKKQQLEKETENTLLNSIVDINKEIDSLTEINLSLIDKIDLYEKKEKELTQIIEENENQRQEDFADCRAGEEETNDWVSN